MNYYTGLDEGFDYEGTTAWLDRIEAQRALHALPISPRAEVAHQEVLTLINSKTPLSPIERKVLSHPFVGGGATVRLADGKRHVLVNSDIAAFNLSTGNYQTLNAMDTGKKVTPRDLFMNVVAHEYGHLLLGEQLEPRMSKNLSYAQLDLEGPVSREADEAFAFWFGDSVTDLRSPLQGLAFGYKQDGVAFDDTIKMYNDLQTLAQAEGFEAAFDPAKLKKIFDTYKKRVPMKGIKLSLNAIYPSR